MSSLRYDKQRIQLELKKSGRLIKESIMTTLTC